MPQGGNGTPGWTDADMIPDSQLVNYLCSLASGREDDRLYGPLHLRLDMCQQCAVKCAFGKRLLKKESLCANTDPQPKKG